MREQAFRKILVALDAVGGAAADAALDPQALELTRQRLAQGRRLLGSRIRESAYLPYAHHLAVATTDTPAPLAASA